MSNILREGQKAPDFVLPASGGGTVSLAEMRGKKLVLYFYPKDDTSGCTREAIDFNRLRGEFSAAGVEIIGVSADGTASHAKFQKKYGLDLTLASDEAKTALTAYGVWTQKSMFGHKFMGIERSTFLIGPDGEILRVWRQVKVPGHAEEVLKTARSA